MLSLIALALMTILPGQTAEPPIAGDALTVPATVKASPGKLTIITAKTTCKKAAWIVPAGIDADPNDGGRKLTLVAPKGQHVLYCIVSPAVDQTVIAKCIVDCGEGNGPPDVPPDPPKPDAFQTELTALFPKNAGVTEKAQALVLASVYKLACSECRSLENTTFAELLAIISDAINKANGLGPTALKEIRERVRVELTKAAPNLDAELSPTTRAQVADVYGRAALALEACAK